MKTPVLYFFMLTTLVACGGGEDNQTSSDENSSQTLGSCLHKRKMMRDPAHEQDVPHYEGVGQYCFQGKYGATPISEQWCEQATTWMDPKKELYKFTPNGQCSEQNVIATCKGSHKDGNLNIVLYDTTGAGINLEKAEDALKKTCTHLKLVFKKVP